MIDALYQVCSIVQNKILLERYEKDMHEAFDELQKQKRVLENRLKQSAIEKNIQKAQIEPKKSLEQVEIQKQKAQNYFDMLNSEDSDELEDLCSEMDSYVSMMFKKENLDESYIYKFSDAIAKYGSILNLYPLFAELSTAMSVLSRDIRDNIQKIKEDHNEFAEYFESFHFSLENFRAKVWGSEVDDPTFFNSSFLSDINLLIMLISSVEDNLDTEIDFF